MTIVQMEYLLAVVNYGSFSMAARRCFVSQPSLSMQIKSLEEELGVQLLDRSKKPVVATEVGEVVVENIRQTLMAYNNIREAVADIKGEISGRLRLGVIPTISPYLTHRFVPYFVKRYPKVELEISDMVTADIVEALKSDRIDIAIVAGGTCGEGIVEQELFKDRFYLYVSAENKLFSASNVNIEDIDLRELILLSTGNCMRDQVLELCSAKQSIPSDYSFVSCSIETLMRIVDSTKMMTIIPEIALEYIPESKRERVKLLSRGEGCRIVSTAVSRTYVKKSLLDALRESITSTLSPLIGL